MNENTLRWAGVTLFSAAMLGVTSCSSIPGKEDVTAFETPSGAIIVETFKTEATVTAIDASTRKVTLEFANKKKTTYKCGPEVVNFPQIQVGDRVKAEVSEEAAIYIGTGAPPSDLAAAGVALAPVGYKPGGVLVDSVTVTARVQDANAAKHKVTLLFADGSTKTVKVGSKIDLTTVRVGTDVTVQVSEGVAISVTR